MEKKTLGPILAEHPFFRDLKSEYFDILVGCASNVRFREGEIIFHEGDPADQFFLIRQGRVAIETPVGQGRTVSIQTVQDGEIVGWSWLIEPYRTRFQCRAVMDCRAIALDGKCLREKCENDHELGYELFKRLTKVFAQRLEYTRMQLLDLYDMNVKGVDIDPKKVKEYKLNLKGYINSIQLEENKIFEVGW